MALLDCQTISETLPVRNEADIYAAINVGRTMAIQLGFDLANQTRLETIIAELTRNALRHGGGGTLTLQCLERNGLPEGEVQLGLEVTVEDKGPGIANLAQVLADKRDPQLSPNASGGLGVGIPAVRRLADDFAINSVPGRGTRVRACKWRRV